MYRFTPAARALPSIFLLLLGLISVDARATTRIWPGVAPCATTLQACITASANDDVVTVQSNGPIDEDVAIPKPLTLQAGTGYRPMLAAGRGISAYYGPGVGIAWSMTIDGIGFVSGGVGVRSYNGDAHITLRRLDVNAVTQAYVGGAVGIDNFGGGHLTFDIDGNRIRLNDTTGLHGIDVGSGSGGIVEGRIHDNRIESYAPANITDSGIVLIGTSASAPSVQVYSNQLSGNIGIGLTFWFGGQSNVSIMNNVLRTNVGSFSYGMQFIAASGAGIALAAQVFNNTIAGYSYAVFGNGAGVSGRVSGNLLAYANGFPIKQQSSVLSEDHNLFFASSNVPASLGAGSFVADPKFRRGLDDVRLSAGSPAIDAADSAALSTVLANAGAAATDADGLRRFKGAANLADIGAFEYGDAALIAIASASSAVIDSPLLNGAITALPQSVENQNPDTYVAGAIDPALTALTYASAKFAVIDQADGSAPTPGSAYNIFAPGPGTGVFQHTSSMANVSGFTTLVDNAYLNGQPDRIVLATQRTPALFNHPVGVVYGFGFWFISQLDGHGGDPDFPSGLNFHIYAQEPSINAFAWAAPVAGTSTAIEQVLINGDPCARLYVSDGNLDPHPIGVKYLQGRWTIINLDGGTMPQGAYFYVVVDEAATQFCHYDHIFHNGVEAN